MKLLKKIQNLEITKDLNGLKNLIDIELFKDKYIQKWNDKSIIKKAWFIALSFGVVLLAILLFALIENIVLFIRYRAIIFYPEATLLRFGLVVLSGLSGFCIGWFLSPEAKAARKILVLSSLGLMGIFALIDQGPMGWGASLALGSFIFAIGFGYWIKRGLKSLGEVPTTFGSSRFADQSDLSNHKMFDNKGLALGSFFNGHSNQNIHYNGDGHLLTSGPTRSQKGTAMIIPNLLSYEGSILVIDPKGENAMITAKHRETMG